jgi:3-phosphoshikimate 1-carboxyvinyltransferase
MNVKISINKKFNKETASINLPSSKSISNRVLILSSLANQRCEIQNLSKANDTVLLKKLLQIGNSKTLNCEDAGTTFRFLLTYCSLIKGNWHITGTSRLFNRPYKDLLNVLIKNGAYIEVNELKRIINISGGNLKGGKISIDGNVSSQFISSLLLCGASMQNGLQLIINKNIISSTYISMTLDVIKQVGIKFKIVNNQIIIPNQKIKQFKYYIESDWSSVAFFYLVSLLKQDLKLDFKRLDLPSTQGDSIVFDITKEMGAKSIFKQNQLFIQSKNIQIKESKYHCNDYPDLVPVLIVMHAALGVEATFVDINNLRFKESNRIDSLKINLGKYGVSFRESKNILHVKGKIYSDNYVFHSFNDHRIAMALAPLALLGSPVVIKNAEAVKKSFPDYWKELKKCGLTIQETEKI